MSFQLVATSGPDKGHVFPLLEGPDRKLGRSPDADYRVDDSHLSRKHCAVVVEAVDVTVVCLGGSGGTLVNGKRVRRQKMKPGDTLKVGQTELLLQFSALSVASVDSGDEPAPPARELQLETLVGQTLGHYHVNMVIGEGDTCLVFQATDTRDDHPVALKVLRQELVRGEKDRQRFVRAMRTVLPLSHPNLVSLYNAGKKGRYCWMAMEYVAGENMQQVINRIGVAGMLDWRHGFRVALHVARALDHVAGQGIVHRNVTPRNILRDATNNVVKLGDLMLAKALEGSLAEFITRPGELLGNLAYMSPERTHGAAKASPRSDLYGLGATVYALLTGRPPLAGVSLGEMVDRIRHTEPERPTKYQLSIPGLFEGVVLKLLAKQPEQRYQTAGELLKELERVGRYCGISMD